MTEYLETDPGEIITEAWAPIRVNKHVVNTFYRPYTAPTTASYHNITGYGGANFNGFNGGEQTFDVELYASRDPDGKNAVFNPINLGETYLQIEGYACNTALAPTTPGLLGAAINPDTVSLPFHPGAFFSQVSLNFTRSGNVAIENVQNDYDVTCVTRCLHNGTSQSIENEPAFFYPCVEEKRDIVEGLSEVSKLRSRAWLVNGDGPYTVKKFNKIVPLSYLFASVKGLGKTLATPECLHLTFVVKQPNEILYQSGVPAATNICIVTGLQLKPCLVTLSPFGQSLLNKQGGDGNKLVLAASYNNYASSSQKLPGGGAEVSIGSLSYVFGGFFGVRSTGNGDGHGVNPVQLTSPVSTLTDPYGATSYRIQLGSFDASRLEIPIDATGADLFMHYRGLSGMSDNPMFDLPLRITNFAQEPYDLGGGQKIPMNNYCMFCARWNAIEATAPPDRGQTMAAKFLLNGSAYGNVNALFYVMKLAIFLQRFNGTITVKNAT